MAAVELIHLGKKYGDTAAVRDVSLQIADGEFLVLLGPSGCGKSTILKLIAGLETAGDGEIYLGGKMVNYLSPKERNVAMVFQNYALYPHMDVNGNLGFAWKLAGRRPEAIREAVEGVARSLHIQDLLHRKPAELSGGQRQRVGLARAIIRNPAVFLMDEPLSNLDAGLRANMRTELLELAGRLRTTFVYVTHDQVEAMTLGHRIAIMRNGLIEQVGPPREVYDRPANEFVAGFLGGVGINLIRGALEPKAGEFSFRNSALHLRIRPPLEARVRNASLDLGASLTLGIRPEDLHLTEPAAAADLRGEVCGVEWFGCDQYVNALSGEQKLKLRVPPRLRIGKGETIGLRLDWARVHLFDRAGANLSTPTP